MLGRSPATTTKKPPRIGDVRGSVYSVWDYERERYTRTDRREVYFGGLRQWQPFHRLSLLFHKLPEDVRTIVGLFAGFTSLVKPKEKLPPVPLVIFHNPLSWGQPQAVVGQLCQWGDCMAHLPKDRAGRPVCEIRRCDNICCFKSVKNGRYGTTEFIVCSFCSVRERSLCMWCWADIHHSDIQPREVWVAPAVRNLVFLHAP